MISGWQQLLLVLILLPILLVAVALYFLPSILAKRRRHPKYQSILILNFLLGWTPVWVVALVWALRPGSSESAPPPTPAECGGGRAVPGNPSDVGMVRTPPEAPAERFPDEPPRRRLQTNLMPLWPWSCAVIGALAVLAGVALLAVSLAHEAARSNPVPIPVPLIVLAAGALCVAIGWRWRRWQRAERRRLGGGMWREPKIHSPVHRDPDGTLTICERDPRGTDIFLTMCICGLVALVGLPDLASRGASDAVLAAVAALCAAAGMWGIVRCTRIALVADYAGVVVRNSLRTYRFAWSEVAGFADGRSNGGEAGTMWALAVIGKDGKVVTSRATGRLRSARPATARAVVALAARHAIPESITGIPTRQPRPARDTGRGSPQSGRSVTTQLTGVSSGAEDPRLFRRRGGP